MAGPILSAIGNLGLGLLGNLGKRNATPQEDWLGAVQELGLQGAIARYPQQAALYGGFQPGSGTQYQLPVPFQQQQSYTPPAQNQLTPIAYQPAMGMVPPLAAQGLRALPNLAGALGTRALGMVPSTVKAALPKLSRRIAEASGWLVVGGLVYDAAGNLMGKARKRPSMNPLNYRAARRALRRLQRLNQFNTSLDACMPTRRTSRKSWPKKKRKCP